MHVQTCNQYVRLGLFLCVCVCCIKRVCMLVARRHSAPLCLLSRRLSLIYCMERKKKTSKLSPQLLACQMYGLASNS